MHTRTSPVLPACLAIFSRAFSSARQAIALLPLLALAFQPAAARAATYYFSTAGNDANSGLDPSAPKQSLNAAAALALPGNLILFKRGDAWHEPGANPAPLDLRNKSGEPGNFIRFDAYGDGPKPVIASLALLDDAGWTNVAGTTRWQHAVTGFSEAWRLYVDGASKYKVNTSNPAATDADVDQLHEWFIKPTVAGASGIVYVNTGSATVGPHNVEVHPVSARSVVLMENTHYVSLRNLDFRGGSQYNVVYIEAVSSHVVLDENIIQRANGSGLLVANNASPAAEYVSDVTITNNLIDKVWSTQENDPNIGLSGDGIFILHAVDTGLIKGNIVRNWGHVGITLSSYAAGFHGVHNFIVEQNNVSAGASGYMHAFDVDGFEGLTTHNIIRRNLFFDYTSTCHAQGSYNQYYSNILVGVTLTTQPKQSQQPWGLDLIPWKYTDGNWMSAHDNYIVNNTFVSTQQYPIVIGDDATSTSPVANNVVANNIIYSYGPSFGGEIGLAVLPTVRGDTPVRNNAFWDFNPSAPVARYKNANTADNYTAAQLNAAFPALCSGNVQVDPGFADVAQRDFRLSAGSPESVKSGGLDLSAALGAGFVDFDGNPWNPSAPSIGAYQFTSTGQPLSQGKAVTYSAAPSGESAGSPASYLTDGDASLGHLVTVGDAGQRVSATIDLGQPGMVQRLKLWHDWSDGRSYHDVIVQLANSADFSSGVTTVFNNDADNSAGLGAGADAEYAETPAGKEIVLSTPVSARYVRFFTAGNSVDAFNHYAELQVFGYAGSNAAPVIATGPVNQATTVGTSVSFSVSATGTPAPSYQWRKGGVPIAGATAAIYTILSPVLTDAGSYDVVVSNALGTVTSVAAALTVSPAPVNVEQNLALGKPVTYSAIRSGESTGTPVSYLTDGDTSLTHLVAVGNASQLVSVTVNLPQVSTITRLKMWHYWGDGRTYRDVIVQLSTTANFSSGVTTVFNNDTNNSAGFGIGANAEYPETSAGKEIVLGTPVIAQYARFFIAANSVNAFNHYVELQVFGYVGIKTAPVITAGPLAQAVTVGDSVALEVTATGSPAPTYQWRKGGAPIAGATGAIYTIPSAVTADAGSYDVVVTNVMGTVTSPTAPVTVSKAVADVNLGNLLQVYNGSPRGVSVSTSVGVDPVELSYTVTYEGAPTPPVDAGSYQVAVTVNDVNYTGSASGTLVVAPAVAGVTLGNLTHTYDGAPQPVSVTTTPAGLAVALAYNGAATVPVNAGSYAVTATVNAPNYTGSAAGTLVIAPATSPIVLEGLLQAYDGTPRVVTATTTPAGLPVTLTYAGAATAPVNPGVYAVVATISDPNYQGTLGESLVVTVTAQVRRVPALNGTIDGSLQLVLPGSVTLNGSARLTGDLLTPGTPLVKLNGNPAYAGTVDGTGAAAPTSYTITLNGGAVIRHVVRRTDGGDIPAVAAPPAPAGTRDVSLNSAGQSAGDFATVRNLTLNGNVGDVAVPPGTYGNFTANGGSRFILGVPGATQPAIYNLQKLTINGNAGVRIVGPVILNSATAMALNGPLNDTQDAMWLEVNIAAGGLTLNGGSLLNGYVTAPAGTVTINGNTTLTGGVIADQLVVNGSGQLIEPAN